jgi:uncharacterized protein YfaS (alpha-2-macroglobulin family)
MGKRTFVAVALTSSVLLALVPGCKKSRREAPAGPPTGELRVVFAGPQGPTAAAHEAERVIAIFDRPMVPLEALSDRAPFAPLRLEPDVPGTIRWLGTRTLIFTPAERFPYATTVKASIPRDTRSLDNAGLASDFAWTFETVRPRLVSPFPSNQQTAVKLDVKPVLVFSQAVAPPRARDYIKLEGGPADGPWTPVGFSLRTPSAAFLKAEEIDAEPETVLVLEPDDPLKPDFAYVLDVKEGLPSGEGPLGMAEAESIRFETYKTFAWIGLGNEGDLPPHEALRLQFTNPVSYKELIAKLRFEPPVEIPDYYEEWDQSSATVWLTLPLEPETDYKGVIAAGLADDFGNVLGQPVEFAFRSAPYEPYVGMTTGHGILESYGDLKVPVSAVNIPSILFQAARVAKDRVIPLLTSERVFWQGEAYAGAPGFFGVSRRIELGLPRNERRVVPLPLEEVLPDRTGFVFIQLDAGAAASWNRFPKAFIQSTGLGLSAKFSPDNNVVWVSDLKTGEPAADAEVEIRDDANAVRWSGRSGADGKVLTPGWKALGFKVADRWSKPQQWVFATRGRDAAFLSSEWGTGIEPYRFGIEYDWNPEPPEVQGAVFSERGIYRAGETVHVKGILRTRDKGDWRLPRQKTVACEVHDPFDNVVELLDAPLDDFGSFSFDIETAEDAALGSYLIAVRVPSERPGAEDTQLGGSFRVEAFRPAEFEVHLRAGRDAFVFGDVYQADVRASYLFGGAMAGQKAAWRLRFDRASYAPPGLGGFAFGRELEWGEEDEAPPASRLVGSGDVVLDASGRWEVKVPLIDQSGSETVLATLEATVQSPSRRSISNRIQSYVHRAEFYIGLRPATTFLKKGDPLEVDIVAAAPEGALLPGKKVSLKLIRREWRSVRKAGVGGRFGWLSEKTDTVVEDRTLTTGREPARASFKPDKAGLYILDATGTDARGNPASTSTSVYITGADYVPWERTDDDALEIVADRETYDPGATARLLIKSPYERAKALVTVERELILDSKVLEIKGSGAEIEIPVKAAYIPNVFVSVLLIQGRTTDAAVSQDQDLGKPSFKLGYAELRVNPAEKRLKVEILPDRTSYGPRDEVRVRLKVRSPEGAPAAASLALVAADAGVLNLIGYRVPDPFDAFYGDRPLSVQTSEIRLNVVGQRAYGEKGEEPGGGGKLAEAPSAALGEVELRGDFRSTAYWNPAIKTDASGEAEVAFTLPDNLTTFRLMAVGQTGDSRFGRAEADIKVSKPLLLQAALPRFARVGDVFQGGVVLHNMTEAAGEAVIEAKVEGIVLLDKDGPRAVTVPAGGSQEVLYRFEARAPGRAVFAFRARLGAASDGLEAVLPIKPPRALETVALFDQAERTAEQKVAVPAYGAGPESRLDVQASGTVLSGLSGCVDYLTGYPYLCLEQRLSAVLPYLVAGRIIEDYNLSKLDADGIENHVGGHLGEFPRYQRDDGGYGLWPESRRSSPFLTCYAVFGLVKARQAGYDIEGLGLESAVDYLKRLLREKFDPARAYFDETVWNTVRAFALYDLALVNKAEPAYAEKLFNERARLSLFGKTLLLKALYRGRGAVSAQDALVQDLMNKVKLTPSQAHFEDEEGFGGAWIYASSARTTALILQSLIETGRTHPLAAPVARWLVEKAKLSDRLSTQENFYLFYALNDYARTAETGGPGARYKIRLAGKTLLEGSFAGRRTATDKASFPLADFPGGRTHGLEVRNEGGGALHYGLRMTYTPAQPAPAREEGMAVVKSVLTLDGKPAVDVKGGSLVVVTVEVALPQESHYVVVDDPLPAGLEAVNGTFLTESEEDLRRLQDQDEEGWESWFGFNHVELRDDRVLLFADWLPAGVHRHRYLARALSYGTFRLPGSKAEEMYAPEVFGRSPEREVRVVK